MRRIAPILGIALLFALVLPMTPAFAAVDQVKAFPAVDTKEINNPVTITATALTTGAPTSGQVIGFRIVSGPNLSLGYLGSCTTGGTGQCSKAYTGTTANPTTPDSIQVWNDLDANTNQNGSEVEVAMASRPAITWMPTGQGTKKVRIDMEACNGSLGPVPIDEATWNPAAATTQVGGTSAKEVCAARFGPATGGPPPTSEPTTPGPVTFTITSGPGHFTDSTGAQNLGSTVTVDVGAGSRNHAYVQSTSTGTTTVQASAETFNASGTIPWGAAAARIIDVSTTTPTRVPGQSAEITAHVTDRYGNDVGGVTVTFTEAGVGSFSGGTSSAMVVTGPTGLATVTLFSSTSDLGTNTVTGTISSTPPSECGNLAGNPPGSPAGVCSDNATVTFATGSSSLTAGVTPPVGVWGTSFRIAGVLTSAGGPVAGRRVDVLMRGAGATTWTPVGSSITDAAGAYSVTHVPDRITDYKAMYAGEAAFGAAASPIVQAIVRYGISINVASPRILVGRAASFTGRVQPEHAGALVYLQLLSGGVWRTVQTSRLDAMSRFHLSFTKGSPGSLLFRAVTPSSSLRGWNASRNIWEEWVPSV